MSYEKNKYRRDTIARFGPETGLPLFEETVKPLPEPHQSRFKGAPKAMYVARETRKNAHTLITFDGVALGNKQHRVYEVLLKIANEENWEIENKLHAEKKLQSLTNTEIAYVLDVPINQVVGRTFELREFGLVVEDRRRVCSRTGMVVMTWRAASDEERKLFKERSSK